MIRFWRNTCASQILSDRLLNAGFTQKDVKEWAKNIDIKMTANIYGHLDTSRKQDMAVKLTVSLFAKC